MTLSYLIKSFISRWLLGLVRSPALLSGFHGSFKYDQSLSFYAKCFFILPKRFYESIIKAFISIRVICAGGLFRRSFWKHLTYWFILSIWPLIVLTSLKSFHKSFTYDESLTFENSIALLVVRNSNLQKNFVWLMLNKFSSFQQKAFIPVFIHSIITNYSFFINRFSF